MHCWTKFDPIGYVLPFLIRIVDKGAENIYNYSVHKFYETKNLNKCHNNKNIFIENGAMPWV